MDIATSIPYFGICVVFPFNELAFKIVESDICFILTLRNRFTLRNSNRFKFH